MEGESKSLFCFSVLKLKGSLFSKKSCSLSPELMDQAALAASVRQRASQPGLAQQTPPDSARTDVSRHPYLARDWHLLIFAVFF